jgi:hypothetical protein
MSRVIEINENLLFDDGSELYSEHDQDCCESHYLSFDDLTLSDFDGLDFDLDGKFFEEVPDFGIRLISLDGRVIPIPGYGSNNGYYSSNLSLILARGNYIKEFNISDCQDISWG